jgi:hypothetical protein
MAVSEHTPLHRLLQVEEAFGLAASARQVACACAQGVVQVFSSKTLAFRATLPRCRALDARDCPDAHACAFAGGGSGSGSGGGAHASDGCLLVVYGDRSLVMWDISCPAQVRAAVVHTRACCHAAQWQPCCAPPALLCH